MFRAGFYEKEITPPLGTTIFGYFSRRINSGVKDKLYAKAVVLENGGEYAALLSIDSMAMPPNLPETVRKRVEEKTDIDGNSILIAVTHSHTSGPCRNHSEFKHPGEKDIELDIELDKSWMKMLALLAADTIILAYQRLEEVNIRFGIGQAKGISFVRQAYTKDGDIKSFPQKEEVIKPYSEADPSVPVFFITDKYEKPMGIITSFAMHHDTVGGNEISADYSGNVASRLKKQYGSDFVSVFFAGFCGNINHINYMGEPNKRTTDEIGMILTDVIIDTIAASEKVLEDCIKIGMEKAVVKKRELAEGVMERVKYLRENPPENISVSVNGDEDSVLYVRSERYLDIYDKDDRKEISVFVQVIKIGGCLIYALTNEMFSQIAEKIKKGSPTDKVLMVELANCDGVSGIFSDIYVPAAELFLPKVYEAKDYSAIFQPDAGNIMAEKALETANKIY